MKKAIVAMLLMAVFLLGGGGLISIVFSSIAGGGVEQSFIYPNLCGNNCAGWSYCWCGRYYCE